MSGYDDSTFPPRFVAGDGEVVTRRCPSGTFEATVWAPCARGCGKVRLKRFFDDVEDLAVKMAELVVKATACESCVHEVLRRSDLCPECHRLGYAHTGRCAEAPPIPPDVLAALRADRAAEGGAG